MSMYDPQAELMNCRIRVFLYVTWPSFLIHSILMSMVITKYIGWVKVKMMMLYLFQGTSGFNILKAIRTLPPDKVSHVLMQLCFFALAFSPVFLLAIRRYQIRREEFDRVINHWKGMHQWELEELNRENLRKKKQARNVYLDGKGDEYFELYEVKGRRIKLPADNETEGFFFIGRTGIGMSQISKEDFELMRKNNLPDEGKEDKHV